MFWFCSFLQAALRPGWFPSKEAWKSRWNVATMQIFWTLPFVTGHPKVPIFALFHLGDGMSPFCPWKSPLEMGTLNIHLPISSQHLDNGSLLQSLSSEYVKDFGSWHLFIAILWVKSVKSVHQSVRQFGNSIHRLFSLTSMLTSSCFQQPISKKRCGLSEPFDFYLHQFFPLMRAKWPDREQSNSCDKVCKPFWNK